MAIAGAQNLLAHHERVKTLRASLLSQDAAYRARVMRELGPNPSSTRIALAEAAVLTYSSILIVHNELLHRSRKDVLALTERVSWLTSNQSRLLKQLSLDARAKPRTLQEVFDRQAAATPSKAAKSGGNQP